MQHEEDVVCVVCELAPGDPMPKRYWPAGDAAKAFRAVQGSVLQQYGVQVVADSRRDGASRQRTDIQWEEKAYNPVQFVEVADVVHTALLAIASSGITTAVFQMLNIWVNERNGRKLKIKVGDIEVEATQMKEEDVLRIFELLEEKADRKKIREALIEAGKAAGRPDAR